MPTAPFEPVTEEIGHGADDDDDYEDECVAETWRDGGVLSEADA